MTISAAVTGLISLLTEVFQDIISKTSRSPAIPFHNLKSFCITLPDQINILIRNIRKILMIKQKLVYHNILRREQQDTLRCFTISPRTSGFLIIILHALRHIIMNDKSDIGFINSHTESIRSNDHRSPVIYKIILAFFSVFIIHTGMISCHLDTFIRKQLVKSIYIFSCSTIYDPAIFRMFPDIFQNIIILLLDCLYIKIQIFTIKSGYDNLRILQLKNTGNVILYFLCCCSSECTYYRSLSKSVYKIHDLKIAWSEVLSPL